jgi:aryl-alcohol dehydrogenase-like predicted oxidoreductase
LLEKAVQAGLQLIDTAHTYTNGQSEETIGAALSPLPEGVVVATKGGYAPGHGRAEVLREQIETSLRRLRADSIGLYYLHRVDPHTPLEESLGAISQYVDRGQIRLVGLSQVGIREIERARNVVPIAAVQNHYNLSERGWDEVVDYCAGEGIVFVPYFPLRAVDGPELTRVADRRGATPNQIALAWLLRRSPTVLPIPGTLSPGHLEQNLGALDIELTDEEFAALG